MNTYIRCLSVLLVVLCAWLFNECQATIQPDDDIGEPFMGIQAESRGDGISPSAADLEHQCVDLAKDFAEAHHYTSRIGQVDCAANMWIVLQQSPYLYVAHENNSVVRPEVGDFLVWWQDNWDCETVFGHIGIVCAINNVELTIFEQNIYVETPYRSVPIQKKSDGTWQVGIGPGLGSAYYVKGWLRYPGFAPPNAILPGQLSNGSFNSHIQECAQAHADLQLTPYDNGGGKFVHPWYCQDGTAFVTIQDFRDPNNNDYAIIDNPVSGEAHLLKGGFRLYYMLAVDGPKILNVPLMEEKIFIDAEGLFGDSNKIYVRQDFQGTGTRKTLVWNDTTGVRMFNTPLADDFYISSVGGPDPEAYAPARVELTASTYVWDFGQTGYLSATAYDEFGVPIPDVILHFRSSDDSVLAVSTLSGYSVAESVGSAQVWAEVAGQEWAKSTPVTIYVAIPEAPAPNPDVYPSASLQLQANLEIVTGKPYVEFTPFTTRVVVVNPTSSPITFWGPSIFLYGLDERVIDFAGYPSSSRTLQPGEQQEYLVSGGLRFWESGQYYFRAQIVMDGAGGNDWRVIDQALPNIGTKLYHEVISQSDLRPEIEFRSFVPMAESYREGDDVVVKVLISNEGDQDITQPFFITVGAVSQPSQYVECAGLNRGNAFSHEFNFGKLSQGTYRFFSGVDVFNDVPEYNEADNTNELMVEVAPGLIHQRFEAENAALQNVSIDTDHAGYSGSGFVDQFESQWDVVSFTVTVPTAAAYQLDFGYSNGYTNAATRNVCVDNAYVDKLVLPSLGQYGWNSWSTASLLVSLTPGSHQVSLSYDWKNQGAINLDYLDVTELGNSLQRYEAEQAGLVNAAVDTDHVDYRGTGFVDQYESVGDRVNFAISVPRSATYRLRFRYARGYNGPATRNVYLGGASVHRLTLPSLGSDWDAWGQSEVQLSLTLGSHQVSLVHDWMNGGAINLDSLEVLEVAAPIVHLEAEAATLTGLGIDTGHWGYSGTGFTDNFTWYDRGAVFTVNIPQSGQYRLVFRYANGTTQNASRNVKVDGVTIGQVTLPALGQDQWDVWADAVFTASLPAGSHTIGIWYNSNNQAPINLDYLRVLPTPALP